MFNLTIGKLASCLILHKSGYRILNCDNKILYKIAKQKILGNTPYICKLAK